MFGPKSDHFFVLSRAESRGGRGLVRLRAKTFSGPTSEHLWSEFGPRVEGKESGLTSGDFFFKTLDFGGWGYCFLRLRCPAESPATVHSSKHFLAIILPGLVTIPGGRPIQPKMHVYAQARAYIMKPR